MTTGPIEARLRISIFFPYKNDAAYMKTFNWLVNRLNRKYFGVMFSEFRPLPVFRGFYLSGKPLKLVRDRLVVVISDSELDPIQDVDALESYLKQLKRELHRRLRKEKEFWIVYYPVSRVVLPTRHQALNS